MPSIQDLVVRLRDELAGAAFESQIQAAVERAVDHYSTEPWWFLEHETSENTVVGDPTIPLPTDYELIRNVTCTVNGKRETVWPQTYDWYLERIRSTSAASDPYAYSVFGETCYLWPTPNLIYPITFSYIRKLSAAVADDNEWADTARYLIGYRAKWDLYLNTNQDMEMAQAMKGGEMEAYARLRRRSRNRRAGPGMIEFYR